MGKFNPIPLYCDPCNYILAGFGHLADAQQKYLTGMDTSLLPNMPSGTPVPNNITVNTYGPWPAIGITYYAPPQISAGQTYQVTAKTVGNTHFFDVKDQWNYGVKNAIVQAGYAQNLRFDGFVHVDVNVAICDRQCDASLVATDCNRGSLDGNSHITINGSKRGNIVTGDGNDVININLVSNGPEWSNEWRLNTGGGDDLVVFAPFNYAGNTDPTYMGNGAGLNTDGTLTSAWVDLGCGNDTFWGYNEKDTVWGREGNDNISTNGGNDVVYGGEGNDTVNGGAGNDTINGDEGNDVLKGGSDQDAINGGTGNDTIDGEAGQDLIHGNDGHDDIHGGTGDDTIYGDAGDDRLFGDKGNDLINGGEGNDYIFGGDDNDTLNGDAGNDCIEGGSDQDVINGGTGNDTINGHAGQDLIHGNENDDCIYGDTGDDTIYGDAGNDCLYGGKGIDALFGGDGNDYANGGDDKDWVEGNAGNDTINTGLYSFDWTNQQASDLFCGCFDQNVLTSLLNGAERGYGGDGNDSLASTGEGPTKDGSDIFNGGKGADLFVFGTNFGHDIITDFIAGAASGDPNVNAGDRIMIQGLTSSSSQNYIFARVDMNGGFDDLAIFKEATPGTPDLNTMVLVRDFFTMNSGVVDVSQYDDMIYNASQLAALGSNNIIAFDGGSAGNATAYF